MSASNRWEEIRQLFKEITQVINPATSGSPGFYLTLRVGSLANPDLSIVGPLTSKKRFTVMSKLAQIQEHLEDHEATCPIASVLLTITTTQINPVPATQPMPQIPPPPPPLIPPLPPTTPPSSNDYTYTV